MILGLLHEANKNAYEIVNTLERRKLSYWVKISSQGVYRNVLQLNKKGYVKGKTIREGKNPPKVLYSITEKGKSHFKRLLKKYAKDIGNYYFNFNTVIGNLDKIDNDFAGNLLNSIKQQIKAKIDLIDHNLILKKDNNTPLQGITIIEQYKLVYDSLLKWIEKFIQQYHKR